MDLNKGITAPRFPIFLACTVYEQSEKTMPRKRKGENDMTFKQSALNLGFLDINSIGRSCTLSYGQTMRSRVFNVTRKNQAFGMIDGDGAHHTAERFTMNDNDIIDMPRERNTYY
ncbi:hypothetical protein A374_17114 [Fictibacillus macauensis ZFHKF-1]|uniref:Uncharacterized protein n=1 Tax=Fictibacillus macauensis ZFHKF-1 TaxID=1196324 RepID=I8IXB4_9BACL|nr:hypothetical protein [Fictibacillus macauensis]EIT84121.1 hypothetical protein A374_17114 [Fictibacillus macauensis ZFHKF-1]